MNISDEAVEAAHRAICEDDLDECLEWRGKCVKALEAAAPHMIASGWDAGYAAGVREEQPGRTKNPYRE